MCALGVTLRQCACCLDAGQRRYDDNKGSPPNVSIDAWAEAEIALQAGVGIKEVRADAQPALRAGQRRCHAGCDLPLHVMLNNPRTPDQRKHIRFVATLMRPQRELPVYLTCGDLFAA